MAKWDLPRGVRVECHSQGNCSVNGTYSPEKRSGRPIRPPRACYPGRPIPVKGNPGSALKRLNTSSFCENVDRATTGIVRRPGLPIPCVPCSHRDPDIVIADAPELLPTVQRVTESIRCRPAGRAQQARRGTAVGPIFPPIRRIDFLPVVRDRLAHARPISRFRAQPGSGVPGSRIGGHSGSGRHPWSVLCHARVSPTDNACQLCPVSDIVGSQNTSILAAEPLEQRFPERTQ